MLSRLQEPLAIVRPAQNASHFLEVTRFEEALRVLRLKILHLVCHVGSDDPKLGIVFFEPLAEHLHFLLGAVCDFNLKPVFQK